MKTVNVLVIKDHTGDKLIWSAQCLEHDIAAQGDTIDKAMMELTKLFVAEEIALLQAGLSMDAIPKAPQAYWAMFNEAARIEAQRSFPVRPSVESELPPAYMIPEFRESRVAQ